MAYKMSRKFKLQKSYKKRKKKIYFEVVDSSEMYCLSDFWGSPLELNGRILHQTTT